MTRNHSIPLALATLLCLAPARAQETNACDASNRLPLELRLLELAKAQRRHIDWVKLWTHATNQKSPGKRMPSGERLRDLAGDLRKARERLGDCADALITEHASAPERTRKNADRTVEALKVSKKAMADLEQALQVGELHLSRKAKKGD